MHRRRRVHRAVDRLLPRRAAPRLRIVVLEAAFAGYGASGRNGGWVTAELPGSRARYARAAGGTRACGRSRRRCGPRWTRWAGSARPSRSTATSSGAARLSVATTPAQLARLRDGLAGIREWGDGDDVYQFLSRDETRARVNVAGALGGLYAPPAPGSSPPRWRPGSPPRPSGAAWRSTRRRPSSAIEPATAAAAGPGAVARTKFGDVRARSVLRCTEGYTAALPGQRRALLPMNSHMVVTEPLARGRLAGDRLGRLRDAVRRGARLHVRAADGGRPDRARRARPALPVRLGLDHLGMTDPATVAALTGVLRRLFPAAACAADRARLVRRARRAPRLVRHGDLRPDFRALAGRRLHRPRRRRRQPGRADARRPGPGEPPSWRRCRGSGTGAGPGSPSPPGGPACTGSTRSTGLPTGSSRRPGRPAAGDSRVRLGEALGRVGDAISGIPHSTVSAATGLTARRSTGVVPGMSDNERARDRRRRPPAAPEVIDGIRSLHERIDELHHLVAQRLDAEGVHTRASGCTSAPAVVHQRPGFPRGSGAPRANFAGRSR